MLGLMQIYQQTDVHVCKSLGIYLLDKEIDDGELKYKILVLGESILTEHTILRHFPFCRLTESSFLKDLWSDLMAGEFYECENPKSHVARLVAQDFDGGHIVFTGEMAFDKWMRFGKKFDYPFPWNSRRDYERLKSKNCEKLFDTLPEVER